MSDKNEELPREATIKKFFIVQQEGKREVRRELDHYNLDVIIAISYYSSQLSKTSCIMPYTSILRPSSFTNASTATSHLSG